MPIETDDELREHLWELEQIRRTEESRYSGVAEGALTNTGVDRSMIDVMLPDLTEALDGLQQEALDRLANSSGSKRRSWEDSFVVLDPEVMAFVALRSAFSVVGSQTTVKERTMITGLGRAVLLQIAYERWQESDDDSAAYIRRLERAMAHKTPTARRLSIKRFQERLRAYVDSHDIDSLNSDVTVGLGSIILQSMLDRFPSVFVRYYRAKAKDAGIAYTDDFLRDCADLARTMAETRPLFRPMLVPPKPWTQDDDGRWSGGYYALSTGLFRRRLMPHVFEPSHSAVEALNQIQATPWRVNTKTLAFCRWLLDNVTTFQTPEAPAFVRVDPFTWEAMSQEERLTASAQHRDRRREYMSQVVKLGALHRKVSIAAELQEINSGLFYQPHRFDFRGRIYPINADLSSQGDAWAKGLIEFHNGVPLGDRGLDALALHLANCAGHDKLSIDDRMLWAYCQEANLRAACQSPGTLWAYIVDNEIDEPLPFAAAAYEFTAACLADDPTEFVSHLPVAVDGTCNGLQILSLLGLDPVGAKSTNCTSDPVRHDIYQDVADKVTDALRQASDPRAALWLPEMESRGRKIVKRAVMTTPYGVTDRGIITQLLNDKMVPEEVAIDGMTPGDARFAMATYMGQAIIDARASVVSEAVRIMDYIQQVTKLLGEENQHLSWVTPDGCGVVQKYCTLKTRRIRTYEGGMRRMATPTPNVDTRKAMGAAAPNVVHSFDASMLRDVVLSLRDLHINSVSMIHDSYAVHAAHLPTLQTVIRKVAIDHFGPDVLAEFHANLPPIPGLPTPPPRGNLDITELESADYFFS